MGLTIGTGISYPAPSRDIEFIDIAGRDGSVVVDKNRYEDVTWKIPVILNLESNTDVEQRITQITNWLLTDVRYHDFLWSSDPDFIYRAMCHQQYNVDRLLRTLGKAIINFRLHPVKYLSAALTERQVTNNTNIVNPYNIAAKPRMRILGSNNITIRVRNSELRLQGIANGGCIVDSESQTITSLDGQRTIFERMTSYPFPELLPGNNNITVPSGVQLHMVPRLGALV